RIAFDIIKRVPHINPGEGIINERSAPGCIYLRLIRNMDESRPGIFVAVLPFVITELRGDAAHYIFGILLCTEERRDLPDGFIDSIDVACSLPRQYFCSCRF